MHSSQGVVIRKTVYPPNKSSSAKCFLLLNFAASGVHHTGLQEVVIVLKRYPAVPATGWLVFLINVSLFKSSVFSKDMSSARVECRTLEQHLIIAF